jgi:lipoate synthase
MKLAADTLLNEPEKVAKAVAGWEHLNYIVVTCVDRDDLLDFGALHIAKTVKLLKKIQRTSSSNHSSSEVLLTGESSGSGGARELPTLETNKNIFLSVRGDPLVARENTPPTRTETKPLLVETLLGDFRGDTRLVDIALSANMDVFAHNIETVERLQGTVRDRRAGYAQSLKVLEHVANTRGTGCSESGKPEIVTKTSIMLGLGERSEEVEQCLRDLYSSGVRAVTLGQYLKPSWKHMPVDRYVTVEEFKEYGEIAANIGFDMVASGPMVRSSYRAGELYLGRLIESKRLQHGSA